MASPFGGIDPDYLKSLQALAAQMGPSDDDKKAAQKMGLLQFGLSALANIRKPTAVGLGEAGSTGLLSYQQNLAQQAQQRMQNISQAGQVYKLGKDAQMTQLGMDAYNKYLQGGNAPQSAPQGSLGSVGDALSSVGGPAGQMFNMAEQTQASQPQQQQQMSPRDALAGVGMAQGFAKGDVVPALNFMFKDPVAMRAGAGYMDNQGVYHEGMTAPPGYTFNPQTQKLTKIEGAPEAFAANAGAVTGAQEQSKAERDLIPVPMGDGTTQMMTRADAVSYLQNKNKKVSVGGPGQAINVQGASPAQVSQMDADIASGGKVFAPFGQQAAQLPQLGRTPNPIAMKAAEAAASGRAEYGVKNEAAIDDAAGSAMNDMARNTEIRNLVTNFKPGALTPMRGDLGAMAAATGLPESVVTLIAGGKVGAIQAMGKLVTDGAFDSARAAMAGGGRVTQAEILLKAKNSPNAALTPEAINAMLDFKDGVNTWMMDRQQAKNDWASQGGDPSRFAGDWNKSHPLTSYVPSAEKLNAALFPDSQPKSAKTVGGYPVQDLVDEARRRGLAK